MKNCPFCDNSGLSLSKTYVHRHSMMVQIPSQFRVVCNNCKCEGPISDTPEIAEELWNQSKKKEDGK